MKRIHFTREQVTKILEEIAQQKGGYQVVLKICLDAMMRAEREEHNKLQGVMSNGYRYRNTFGQGKILELQVPRSRRRNSYPVLLSLLRDQEEECRNIAFSLYGAGLTTEQVGNIFGELYGKYYSTSQISRMFEYSLYDVQAWLNRPLEPYYPIILIDATFIYTRRKDHVSKEAFYTILGVRKDRTREVLSIVNFPTENAPAWKESFAVLKDRGLEEVGLVICDSLTSIETAIWSYFPPADIQLCTIHLQRNILKRVKPKDKTLVIEDFKDVFRTGERNDSSVKGWNRWINFCSKWGYFYLTIKCMAQEQKYKLYFTYLDYDYRIHNMIYSTNWIERLNRDYKRTTRMRGALPNPEATILLLGYVAMNRSAYQ